MKILCADHLADEVLAPLREAGHEVIVDASATADSLPALLAAKPFEVLVVRSTKVDAKAIGANGSLGLIVRAGAGTDNIDCAAASALGIYVTNVPGKNAVAVAELAMALLLAIDRNIASGMADLRAGRWDKASYSKADGLFGKSVAVLGVGEIGLAFAERAAAFGMTVRAVDKPRSAQTHARIVGAGIELVPNLDTLLQNADVVSLHLPKSADTDGLVDQQFLAKLKPGAVLINTARGSLIDAEALVEAMDNRGLRVGLDVWPDEPSAAACSWDSDLASHPNVVGSHHIGASTAQAQRAVAAGTVDVVQAYIEGRVINCINLQTAPVGKFTLTVRHYDKVGVLAKVFQALRGDGVNVQQVQNQIFAGAGAAVASMHVVQRPSPQILQDLGNDPDVLAVSLVDLS